MPDIDEFIKELTPFELEYVDKGGSHFCLKSYIKRIYDDYIFISPPQKENLSFNIPDGQEITIVFKTEKGVLSASSAVIGKQLDTMPGLKISFPYNSRFTERRTFIRTPLKLNVEIVKFLDSDHKNEEILNIQTRNISGNGLSYVSNCPLDNYYDIYCKIHLNDGKEPVNIRCEHIYSKKIRINSQKAYLTALAFIDIQEEYVSRIVKACFNYQIKNKK
jgi:c-di-GMP-binding flagellar brake protein YcgR